MGLTLAADVCHEEKVKKGKLSLALRLKCERCCHEHKGTFIPPGVVWFWGAPYCLRAMTGVFEALSQPSVDRYALQSKASQCTVAQILGRPL